MNKEKQTPKIRFDKFVIDWKRSKLGDGTSIIGDGLHGTPQYSEKGNVAFINGNNLINGKIIITKKTKFVQKEQQSKKDKLLNSDTILMSINGTIGNLAYYAGEKVMLGKSTSFLEVTRFNKKFMYQLLQTNKIKRYFLNNLTGSTIKNLGLKTIRETPCSVPMLEEQIEIGEFFKQIDDIITLQQQLLNDHKQLKKAMLQKMFPQKGESIPKIRFAGFTQKWENLKLSSLYVKGASGGTPKSTNKSYYIGNIPFLGISDISASNGYIYDTKKRISQEGLDSSSAWLVPKEAISLAMYASVGKVAILKTDVATSQAFYNMIFKDIATRNFIFQYLLKKESTNGWNKLISTGTQANLNAKKIQDLQIMVPSLEEQEKIGDLFGKLDKTITLHEKKLETYQNLKKAMLQKMFV